MSEDSEYIELDVIEEECCKIIRPTKVTIKKSKFKELCQKYGFYGIGWYFVASHTIKCFKKQRWEYENVL